MELVEYTLKAICWRTGYARRANGCFTLSRTYKTKPDSTRQLRVGGAELLTTLQIKSSPTY